MHRKHPWTNTTIQSGHFWARIVKKNRVILNVKDQTGHSDQQLSSISGGSRITQDLTKGIRKFTPPLRRLSIRTCHCFNRQIPELSKYLMLNMA
jgi:hypothetical protein